MGVTENEFVSYLPTDIGQVKLALLLAKHGVKTNVHKHIAQLLAYFFLILACQRIAEFKSFLYCIGTQALISLHRIPRALLSQFVEHIQQVIECLQHLFA